jgi:hypothetical protein
MSFKLMSLYLRWNSESLNYFHYIMIFKETILVFKKLISLMVKKTRDWKLKL